MGVTGNYQRAQLHSNIQVHVATSKANKSCLSREEQAEERQGVRFWFYWTELRAGSSWDKVILLSFKLGDSRELAGCSVLHLIAVFFLNMVDYWSKGFSGRHSQWGRVVPATRGSGSWPSECFVLPEKPRDAYIRERIWLQTCEPRENFNMTRRKYEFNLLKPKASVS